MGMIFAMVEIVVIAMTMTIASPIVQKKEFENRPLGPTIHLSPFEDHIEGLSICGKDTYSIHRAVRK
jgi:hypothetical protein